MQLIRDVEELLKKLMLFSLPYFVLLGPPRVQFFIEGGNFIFLLRNNVIDLNFDSIATFLQELSLFLLRQLIDGLNDSIDFRVAIKIINTALDDGGWTYFFYLIRL